MNDYAFKYQSSNLLHESALLFVNAFSSNLFVDQPSY